MIAWAANDTQGFLALNYNTAGAIIGGGNGNLINWTATLLHSGNYNSYSPTLTGGNASGTWGINVTGTASSISGYNNPATGATANTIVYRDGSGHISGVYGFFNYLNMSHGASGSTGDTVFYSSGDDYIRKNNATGFRASLNVPTRTGGDASGSWGINVTGSSASCSGNAATATRATAGSNFYIDNNYGYGIVGAYNASVFQGVFAMGDSYKLTAGGGINNLYGMTWSHPNAGGIAGNLDSHGLIVAINGGFGSCMSYSIKASSNVTAYSDERLKKDWVNLPENYVEELAKVKVGTYTRIDGEKLRQVGVSAQSLRPLLPEAVIEATDDFKTLSVAYGNAAMASAVELAKEVVSLKEQLAAVLKRLNKLENK